MFQQEDELSDIMQQPFMCIGNAAENSFVGRNGDSFLNTQNVSSSSTAREISFEFLHQKNFEKYHRLVRDVKTPAPFQRRSADYSRSSSPILFDTMRMHCEHGYEDDFTVDELPSTDHNYPRRPGNQKLETNSAILARRQKQIDYGKNTIGYDNYIKLIPRNKRSKRDPRTPPKQYKFSRRAFDGLVKVWRTKLHCFDLTSCD